MKEISRHARALDSKYLEGVCFRNNCNPSIANAEIGTWTNASCIEALEPGRLGQLQTNFYEETELESYLSTQQLAPGSKLCKHLIT